MGGRRGRDRDEPEGEGEAAALPGDADPQLERGYVLCNWIRRDGAGWADPLRQRVAALRVDVATVLVDSYPAETYAWIWTRHLPEPQRAAETAVWTRALTDEGIERVDIGLVALGRPADDRCRAGRFTAIDRAEQTVDRTVIEAFLAA